MAEVLVRTKPHPSPFIDQGDIWDVKPDGFSWGKKERLQTWLDSGGSIDDWGWNYYIVKLPDAPDLKAKGILDSQLSFATVEPTKVKARKWIVNLEAIPADVNDVLATSGEIEMPYEDARQLVYNKDTGEIFE